MNPPPPSSPDQDPKLELDPVFLHARREALLIFCIWFAALCWCVPCCYRLGFGDVDPDNVPLILGFPAWLFWGIALPWLVADVLTVFVAFVFMKDDDLEDVPEEQA